MPHNYYNYQPYSGSATGLNLTGPSSVPPITPGGGADIDAGYDFRHSGYEGEMQSNLNRQGSNNRIREMAAGSWTDADRTAALGGFNGSDAFYNRGMANGGYDAGTISSLKNDAYSNIYDQYSNMASSVSNALAQRGLAANPYSWQQAQGKGAFAAAGAAGRVGADIRRQQLANEFEAASGSAGNARSRAALYGQTTREGVLGQLQGERDPRDTYNYYRNSSGRSDMTDDGYGLGGGGYGIGTGRGNPPEDHIHWNNPIMRTQHYGGGY